MPVFQTSHGAIEVSNWVYQLQGPSGAPLDIGHLAGSGHELVVIDSSRDGTNAGAFTAAEIDAIKLKAGGGAVAASYLSIGEADDYRDFWNPSWTSNGKATGSNTAAAPTWLGPTNPDWPESRKVRYWESGWQDLVFNAGGTGSLDRIVAQGFDAAYLDIVDAYYFWAVEATAAERQPGDPVSEADAAGRMIDFIVDMTAHARLTNPDFFVILQNGAFIIDALENADPVRKTALLDAVGAIAVEDVYLRDGDADENNGFRPDADTIAVLQRDFLANGKPVFAVDYANDFGLVSLFLERAIGNGFIPTVAPDRDLDRSAPPLVSAAEASSAADLIAGTGGREALHGLAGDDWLFGFSGKDRLYGEPGGDVLAGGRGADRLYGGAGNDRLVGEGQGDWMKGGKGRDVFEWNATKESRSGARDTVADFARGRDKLDLSGIDARPKASGDQKFRFTGEDGFGSNPGEVQFRDAGRGVIVEADVNGDGRADFAVLIAGVGHLGKGDFVL